MIKLWYLYLDILRETAGKVRVYLCNFEELIQHYKWRIVYYNNYIQATFKKQIFKHSFYLIKIGSMRMSITYRENVKNFLTQKAHNYAKNHKKTEVRNNKM